MRKIHNILYMLLSNWTKTHSRNSAPIQFCFPNIGRSVLIEIYFTFHCLASMNIKRFLIKQLRCITSDTYLLIHLTTSLIFLHVSHGYVHFELKGDFPILSFAYAFRWYFFVVSIIEIMTAYQITTWCSSFYFCARIKNF